MPTFTLAPEDLAAHLEEDARRRFEGVVEAIRDEVKLKAEPILQRLISSDKPSAVDRGTARRAFHVDDIDGGAAVYNSAPYYGVLEGGRRAGARMPPVDLIAEWVRRKGIAKEGSARGIAYVIARAIAARGLRAHRWLARMEQELTPDVREAIARRLSRGRE